MPDIYARHAPGKNSYRLPACDDEGAADLPAALCNEGVRLPDVNEVDVVRHYTALSRMNFGVDTGLYPLGSCTMKHNPRINERLAALPAFTGLHPMAGEECAQGALRIIGELGEYLCALTGMSQFSLAPAAGSHGELASVMIMKKYFADRREERDTVIIPDTAHGTNPASVAMCGYQVQEVRSGPDGDVDVGELRRILSPRVAGMMLTNPGTLGLFERNVEDIAKILHDNGSLFYGDGANFNALVGRARMRDMGFDIMHLNLHKTFSTPHGGGGPGAGPIGVREDLMPYLPKPTVVRRGEGFRFDDDRPQSIGRIHSFYGNFLILLRAYVYIRMLGFAGLREVSTTAVLNANYLMARLRDRYHLPIDRRCMHEFVITDRDVPGGVTTNDIAKRLLDYGFHAPTVYFPLIIDGAMMIEPTETETHADLDAFCDAMLRILDEASSDPAMVSTAPHSTPVSRVDAVLAARKPILTGTE